MSDRISEGTASSQRICKEVAEVSHTKGMLFAERIPATFNPKMDGFQLVGSTPDGLDLMTVALCTVNEADEANARRLVAAWNACDGISTERLEDLGRPLMAHLSGCDERAARQVKESDELKAQRDELLGALEETWRVINSAGLLNLSSGVQLGATSWYVKANAAQEMAAAAIAKATP